MNLFLRRKLRVLISLRSVNALLKAMAPLLRRIMPLGQLSRVPIVGAVNVCYDGWKPVQMLNNGSDSIATRIYWGGGNAFDPESIDLFLRLAHSSKVILDIGANTGIYSLLAAMNNPSAQIYAFEPVPNIRGVFDKSVTLNRLTNLKISDLAISNFIGKSEFHIPSDFAAFPTSASLNKEFRHHATAIPVSVTTVDEFVREAGIGRVDLIKIDTESTEHLVVAGAGRTLAEHRPIIVCEMLPEQNPRNFTDLLGPLDYSYFWITAAGLYQRNAPIGDSKDGFLNYLLLPSEKIPLLNSLSLKVFPIQS